MTSMMVTQILVAAILVLYPVYTMVHNGVSFSRLTLAAALWVLAVLNVLDLLAMEHASSFLAYKRPALWLEAALCPVLLVFSQAYNREFSLKRMPVMQKVLLIFSFIPLIMTVVFPASEFFYSPDFEMDRVLFLEPPAFFFYLQILLFMAVSLFNLEMTVTSARHGIKWKIKFAILGAGAIIATYMLYFSQSLMLRSMDMDYLLQRAWGTGVGMLLIMYSELSRGSDEHIVISRQIAFRSFVFLFFALFLLGVGVIGEGIKLFGSDFSTVAFMTVTFFGGLALIACMLSEGIRRKIRLFIQRNFYGDKYDYRDEWKKFTSRVVNSGSRDELYRNILIFYCEIFGIGGGAMFLQGRHSRDYSPVLFHEMDESRLALPHKSVLVERLGKRPGLLDLKAEPMEFEEEVDTFLKDRKIRFILPIMTDDVLHGLLMLGSPINPLEHYDVEDRELMETVAGQVAALVMNIRLGDELAEARDMEGFGKVAAFVLHDLKNQVYPLSLLVDNAREFINDKEFQEDMLDSLGNIVARMNELIAQLTNIPKNDSLKLEEIDLMDMARDAARQVPDAEIEFKGGGVRARVDVEQMRKVALNLFLNALEAGESNRFTVLVEYDNGPVFRVIDNGRGIDEEILREGLFVPFKTTKKKGMGIGLYQSKRIVEAHGGGLYATSGDAGGAVFSVVLPDPSGAND
ncbi:XrtA/PEP-CTERM system histidine kinase PrsK [Pseudodesulfovibrio methanolicus]|uniref:histidine kinase n=1 Tax=Pseudodesulfovibrio methanolicus TaxID=3126690 RepID=A0ABZ2ITD6_9BACT